MKICFGAVVPPPPDQAFAFVSDPRNWPRFIDIMKSAEPGPDRDTVGGHATTLTSMLGRTFESDLELRGPTPSRPPQRLTRRTGRLRREHQMSRTSHCLGIGRFGATVRIPMRLPAHWASPYRTVPPRRERRTQVSSTNVAPPRTARTFTQDPAIEAGTLRGVWFGLLFSAPFWLVAALLVVLI